MVIVAGVSAGCGGGDDGTVPTFVVDALWPMPLEYPAILGPVSGVTVAPDGNILIVTRQDGFSAVNEINSVTGTGDCCTPTAAVVEFAPDGRKVREWGGPDQGYPWPVRPHGIAIDPEGNVWIGGGVAPPAPAGRGGRGGRGAAPSGPPPAPTVDDFILKFSREGRHLMTIGGSGAFGGANGFSFDAGESEVFVADGYDNRRIAVLDMATGEVKREWGAYGNAPSDAPLGPYDPNAPPAQQFRSVTCAELANDGMLYVCDRGNNRLQVFETDGGFVSEMLVAPATQGAGSVSDVAFSGDPRQRFLYVADGMNERVAIYWREPLEFRTTFGVGGRYPSHFRELGGLAVDAAGNVFTAENGQGRRVQRFVFQGQAPVTAEHQGALYPATTGGM
jgi:DNA-binding beta-propeller fold protein YncE